MKFVTALLLILISIQIFSQEEIRIVKVDNSHYPDIEMLIKCDKKFDAKKLKITENKKLLTYTTKDIPVNEFHPDRAFLFLFKKMAGTEIIKFIQKEVNAVKKKDKLNIGVIYKDDSETENVFFVSPEFSNNILYFKNFAEQYSENIIYPISYKKQKAIFKYLFSDNKTGQNSGIIFIGNSQNVEFSLLKNQKNIPVYILQIGKITKEKEEERIKICMNSGGMYTAENEEKKFHSVIERYKEDIALNTSFNQTSVLKKLNFHLSEEKKKTMIIVKYGTLLKSFELFKPNKNSLSQKELYLTIFSFLLLLSVILLLVSLRKEHQKQKKLSERISKKITDNFAKPIEINIRGSGINKTYFFEKHIIRIGRNPDNDVVIPDTTVSGKHAIINKQGKEFLIQDLGSTNGIIINNKSVKKQILKTGEKIKLGGVVMFVRF